MVNNGTTRCLDYIRLGIHAHETFFYNDISITLRPLTSMEIDEAQNMACDEIDDVRLIKTITDIKLGKTDLMDKMPTNPEFYAKIRRFYNTMDYWLVYYSMKDFMPEDFFIDDVEKMQYVHEIAERVIKICGKQSKEVIETIRTADGQELATIVHKYHIPLTDEAWKLTPLQKEFLYWTGENAPKIVNTIEEALNRVI